MEKFYFSMEKTRGQRNQHASWITNFAQNILQKWWLKRKTMSPLNYQKRVLRRGNSTTVGTVIISQKWANSSRVPICQHSKVNDSYKVVSGNYRRGPSVNHNSTHDFPVRQFDNVIYKQYSWTNTEGSHTFNNFGNKGNCVIVRCYF